MGPEPVEKPQQGKRDCFGMRSAVLMLGLVIALIGVGVAARAFRVPPPIPPPLLVDGAIAVERWAIPSAEWSRDHAPPRVVTLVRPDGTVSVITPDDREEACPTFSPDGSRVALFSAPRRASSGSDPAYQLAIANAVPGAAREFLLPGYRLPQSATAPSWAPDGSAVVAVLLPPGQPFLRDGDLVVVPLDGSSPEVILRSPVVAEGEQAAPGMYRFQGAHWSPDGSWIALRGESFYGQVWRYFIAVIRPDGSDVRLLDEWPLRGSIEWGGVAWSPDSEWVAYHRRPPGATGGAMEVYVASLADLEVRRLTESQSTQFVGEWSPDGSRIAAVGIGGDRAQIVEVATGAVTALPPDAEIHGLTWSADGDRIAILEEERLSILDPAGSHAPEPGAEAVPSHCSGLGSGISWQEVAQ